MKFLKNLLILLALVPCTQSWGATQPTTHTKHKTALIVGGVVVGTVAVGAAAWWIFSKYKAKPVLKTQLGIPYIIAKVPDAGAQRLEKRHTSVRLNICGYQIKVGEKEPINQSKKIFHEYIITKASTKSYELLYLNLIEGAGELDCMSIGEERHFTLSAQQFNEKFNPNNIVPNDQEIRLEIMLKEIIE